MSALALATGPFSGRGSATRRRRPGRSLVVAVGFLTFWTAIARLWDHPSQLPEPVFVAQTAIPMLLDGELVHQSLASSVRVLSGFAVATLTAVPIGAAMGAWLATRRLLYPPMEILRYVPGLGILPVFLALFGVGDGLAIAVVAWGSFFPMLVATQDGVSDVDRALRDAALTLGSRGVGVVWEVLLPAALPRVFTGLRIGMQFAWMSLVGAEFVGSATGLGHMILYYSELQSTSKVIVGIVAIGLFGFLLDRAMLVLKSMLAPWSKAEV